MGLFGRNFQRVCSQIRLFERMILPLQTGQQSVRYLGNAEIYCR